MENELTLVFVVAGVAVKKDGKYLLVQEKQPKAYGLWNFPAGRVDKGESIEDAAVREAKEESGFNVELVEKIAILHESVDRPVKHIFSAKIIGGELKWPEDEILKAEWFTFEEIEAMKDTLRGEWILETINILEKNNG